jgi:uncharacterized protein
MRFIKLLMLLAAVPAFAPCAGAQSKAEHRTQIQEWRAERAAGLRVPKGWLTLAGLFWLEKGENTFGSGKDNAVVFPEGGPERIGSFYLQNDSVWVEILPGVAAQHNGESVSRMLLSPGWAVLDMERFSWVVLQRGNRFGVRLWDAEAPALQAFSHIDNFETDKKWRIRAQFVPFEQPRILMVPNALGMDIEQRSPGVLRFKVGKTTCELLALEEGEDALFLIFADATTGKETYGGGRYLSAANPKKKGKTVIDFNKAYNPPCVFTPYATCLLPPAGNRLTIAVTAGEKNYGEH